MILLALELPDGHGLDVCRRINASPGWHDTPIMLLTPRNALADLNQALAAGALDYMIKPLRPAEVIARVRLALRLSAERQQCQAREHALEDLTARLAAANQQLQDLSLQDSLTGVANRRHFDQTLDVVWRQARRAHTWVALLMADIDHFKAYNDTYGHQRGDACLQTIAQALARVVKRAGEVVARYGGEEFAILLPQTDLPHATMIAEALRVAVADLGIEHAASAVSDVVTISIGVAAALPSHETAPETLLTLADQALYQAKAQGRNRVSPRVALTREP